MNFVANHDREKIFKHKLEVAGWGRLSVWVNWFSVIFDDLISHYFKVNHKQSN